METLTRNVILLDELTMNSIKFLRNNKSTHPTFEKIYKNIKKFETNLSREIYDKHFSTMLTRNLICDKNSNSDKESYVINIHSETVNTHPDASLNSLNSTRNSSSIVIASPSTRQHQFNISNHQTETVIANSISSPIENSMPTKEHASKEIPTLTHKQLINAYIEKKTDEILIPFPDKIETLIKSYEAVVKKNGFLQSTNTGLSEQVNNFKLSVTSKNNELTEERCNQSNTIISNMQKEINFLRAEVIRMR